MVSNKIRKITSSWQNSSWWQKPLWLPRYLVLLLITLYQQTISPDHGPLKHLFKYGYCRFHPTCSDYGFEAVLKYGVILGSMKAIYRIIRCNPWNPGGHDPLK